jgi:hypothetical protein
METALSDFHMLRVSRTTNTQATNHTRMSVRVILIQRTREGHRSEEETSTTLRRSTLMPREWVVTIFSRYGTSTTELIISVNIVDVRMTLLRQILLVSLLKCRSNLISDQHIFDFTMRPGNFNSKFSQYLSNKINPEKRQELFRGQFDSEPEEEYPSSVYPFSALNQRNVCINRNRELKETTESGTLRLSEFEYERQKQGTEV